jgi:hypothetical protein
VSALGNDARTTVCPVVRKQRVKMARTSNLKWTAADMKEPLGLAPVTRSPTCAPSGMRTRLSTGMTYMGREAAGSLITTRNDTSGWERTADRGSLSRACETGIASSIWTNLAAPVLANFPMRRR